MLRAYEQASQKSDWLSLRDDILLTESLMMELITELQEGGGGSSQRLTGSDKLAQLADLKRKQSESHARMMKDLHQMISLERVLAIMDRLGTLVRENVTDPKALRAIGEGLNDLIRPAQADVETSGSVPSAWESS